MQEILCSIISSCQEMQLKKESRKGSGGSGPDATQHQDRIRGCSDPSALCFAAFFSKLLHFIAVSLCKMTEILGQQSFAEHF